jgi:4-diphosphocytidyl-2C-methyl-D-erythritol kinase
LIDLLKAGDLGAASREFYNSLEAPALEKYPVLALYQDFLQAHGALATLMSGSGSTTFALLPGQIDTAAVVAKFQAKFGTMGWTAVVPV